MNPNTASHFDRIVLWGYSSYETVIDEGIEGVNLRILRFLCRIGPSGFSLNL